MQPAQDFPRPEISGFVLAGGRSSRLGQDKVLLPWNGSTLLEHAIDRLQQVCGTVQPCGDREDPGAAAGPFHQDAWIRDAIPGAGPLGGIVAALEQSPTPWNFFLAVDLPLVPATVLRAIAARAQHSCDALCILPKPDGLPQPLCGLYHRAMAPGLRLALQDGKYKIMLALRDAIAALHPSRLELLDAESLAELDAHLPDCFLNINTPQDWQRARSVM